MPFDFSYAKKTITAALLLGAVHFSGWAETQVLPKDVATFVEERESCDHWRGEPGFDKERQAEIDRSICDACTGTDAKLAALKKKYRASKTVTAKLGEFASAIEPTEKAAAKRFCQNTLKLDGIDK